MKKTESYLEYFVHVDIILKEYSLTCGNVFFTNVEKYSTMCPWIKKWMNFILNIGNNHYFCKQMNKKNKVETIYVGFFKII